jgi:hypothetical protein
MSHIQLRLKDALDQDRESEMGFHLSTFDIPQNATADIDKEAGLLTFRFRYVDAEAAGPSQRLSDDISIDVGKRSGKLLAVRINVKRYPAGEVRVRFAIDEMDRLLLNTIRNLKTHQRENYELVKAVIDENRGEVESAWEEIESRP